MRRGSGGSIPTTGGSKSAPQCAVKLLDGSDLILEVNVSDERVSCPLSS